MTSKIRRRRRVSVLAAIVVGLCLAGGAAAAAWRDTVTASATYSTGTVPAATGVASTHPNATGASAGQVNLTWTPPGGTVASLRLQRATSTVGPWTTLSTLAATATGANDTAATYNAPDVYYRVQSVAGTWTAETPVWSSHSLKTASGGERVSGGGTATALTAAQVTATSAAEGTYAAGSFYQPATWPTSPQYVAGAFYLDATHAWITGTGSVSFYDGSAWSRQTTPVTQTLEQVSFTSTTRGWAVGQGGVIVATSDGGTTWTSQTSPSGQNLWDLDCIGATTTCVAVGNGGVIIRTTNGTAWTSLASPTTQGLWDVDCISTTACWAVGNGGTIVRTTNGTTWTTQTSGTTSNLQAVSCLDANRCWAVGVGGVMRVTTNGGATWTAGASGTTQALWRIQMIDANVGYLVGSNGVASKTTDGGATWTPLTVPNATYYALSCVNAMDCLTGSTAPAALITKDGGANWSEALPGYIEFVPTTPNLAPTTGVSSVIARLAYRTTTNPAGARFLLFASNDGGSTWSSFPLATPSAANTATVQSVDLTSLGFSPIANATKVRLRLTVIPAASSTLTTQIDLVHVDVN